jgi:hypothetical protein
MSYKFKLVYTIPADLVNIEPAMQELGKYGLQGGALVDYTLTLWFEREDVGDAVAGAMANVLKVLPEVKFVEAQG